MTRWSSLQLSVTFCLILVLVSAFVPAYEGWRRADDYVTTTLVTTVTGTVASVTITGSPTNVTIATTSQNTTTSTVVTYILVRASVVNILYTEAFTIPFSAARETTTSSVTISTTTTLQRIDLAAGSLAIVGLLFGLFGLIVESRSVLGIRPTVPTPVASVLSRNQRARGICPRCQHANRERAKFCTRCGAGLLGAVG